MTTNTDSIQRFYEAFSRRDWRTMSEVYAPGCRFRDEIFELQGEDIAHMWRMLTERQPDSRLSWRDVREEPDGTVRAHWDATYSFGPAKRTVNNSVESTFVFRDGKVVSHLDRFSFWSWSRQALGLPGLLLGWSPSLRKKVQATASQGLTAYRRSLIR